jgi:hypothetical protein
MKKSATLHKRRMNTTRKCPWRTRSRIQCRRMSVALDIRCDTVSAAIPIATSLSQNSGVAGWGWYIHVGQDFSFLCRDAGSGVQSSVNRLRDKGIDNGDAGGVTGDGVVDPVIVVGEPEVTQATGDAACVGVGEEGSA